ncbi:unnamed protein product, partial [Pelagomonas calceolata]
LDTQTLRDDDALVVAQALVELNHLPQLCRGKLLRVPLPVPRHLREVPAVLLHQRRDIFLLLLAHRVPPLIRVLVDVHEPRRLRRVHEPQLHLLRDLDARRRRARHAHRSIGIVAQAHAREVRAPAPARVPVLGDLRLVDLHLLEQALLLLLLRAAGRAGAALLDADHFFFTVVFVLLLLSLAAVLLVGWCCIAAAPVQLLCSTAGSVDWRPASG